ncbi:hypothetical protein BDU57DRAFT_538819 [Ampelomyces quisqualis]|uniref:Uncharacterized protein n=1 Tax=Ampelomyces quisqualis TaxID=50730 RepID=A0A6A5QL88_AMPQU|nr:hypothetical protein BDU57DRAFT_538819 [Ampelomyces quisqualis]
MADDNHVPNYPTKTCKQLRTLLNLPVVSSSHVKLKYYLVAALQESDVYIQEAENGLVNKRERDMKLEYQKLQETIQERGLKVSGTSRKDLRKPVREDDEKKERQRKAEEHKERSANLKEWTDTTYSGLSTWPSWSVSSVV